MIKKKSRVYYLVGSIEHHPSNGWHWRHSLQQFLEERGHKVINPVTEEIKVLQDKDMPKDWGKLKYSNLPEYCKIMKKIIDFDIKVVIDRCDEIIVRWDDYTQKGAGSHAEMTFAYIYKKPVHIIYEKAWTDIPGWLLGCVDADKFYNSLKEFKEEFDKCLI